MDLKDKMEDIVKKIVSDKEMRAKFDKNPAQVLESLLTSGDLVMLTPQICLHKSAYASILETARVHFETQDSLTLAQLRDLLNTSRKYSQAIIEYFDKVHITKKDGDVHYLDQGF